MCTGRVDLSFILHAFSKGADGVIIGGCWPGECHYVTEGNYGALANVLLCRKLLALAGLDPERLRIEWIAASEGARFAEVMTDFVTTTKRLGPLGQREGVDGPMLRTRLAALQKLVPYVKLVERERLRVETKSEAAYREFFASEETDRLFARLMKDMLAMSQIVEVLGERPLSNAEISAGLKLDPSEVSKQVSALSRRGIVTYDVERNRYSLARADAGSGG